MDWKHIGGMASNRKGWIWLGGLAILLVGAVLAWHAFGSAAPASRQEDKVPAGAFRPTKEQWANLAVAEVVLFPFHSTLATDGVIAFNDDALTPVYSPYSGRVKRLVAKLGDTVRKGDPLLVVEASEFVQARNDLAVAEANLDTTRRTEHRQHELFLAGAGAEKDWRQAQADLAAAEAAKTAVRGRLQILGHSDTEIDALIKGGGGNAEAVIVAPISGTVTQRQVGVGQYIASTTSGGGNPVYTIGDVTSVWLVANVRETDAPSIKVGQAAEVHVMALPGQLFAGRITWVGSAVDPATHRLPVRMELRNPGGVLKPQMFASFNIATSDVVKVPAVPESALMHDGDVVRVFRVDDGGTVSARTIESGRTLNGLVEVLNGLRAGDKVITAGTLFIDRATSGD